VDGQKIYLTEQYAGKSRIQFILDRAALYDVQLRNKKVDVLTKTMLRLYEGLFSELVPISEWQIAKILKISKDQVKSVLRTLHTQKIVHYEEHHEGGSLRFVDYRYKAQELSINEKKLAFRKKRHKTRIQKMIQYAEQLQCREKFLRFYLGDRDAKRCGVCDVCVRNKLDDFSLTSLRDALNVEWQRREIINEPLQLTIQEIERLLSVPDKDKLNDLLLLLELEGVIRWSRDKKSILKSAQ